MPRGQPDYGQYTPTEQYATLSDLAEAVNRLLGIIYGDGRGTTVFNDDFEGVLLKYIFMTANGGTVALDSTHAQSGSQSAKIDVAKVLVAGAGISHEFGIPVSQQLGNLISFCAPSAHTAFYNILTYHFAPTLYRAEAYIDFSSNILYIRKADGSYKNVATLDAFSGSDQSFHPFKLVASFDTKVYKRVMVDNVWYDLASEPLVSSATAFTPRILSEFELHGLDATGGALWVDDFIFTQSEP